MNKTAKMVIVLTTITALSGAILSTWDGITKPMIEYHRLQALKAAISEVIPAYDNYNELQVDGANLYVGKLDGQETPVGIAFKTEGSGFQGTVTIMVGMKPDFKTITGIKVLEQIETPGLGTKIVEDPSNKENKYWFPEQFVGVVIEPEIVVLKNKKPQRNNEVQAISGATISSKAVARILNENIANMKKLYQAAK